MSMLKAIVIRGKPCSNREMAEARTALDLPGPVYRFGLFEFDPANGQLMRSGTIVRLQEQPIRILALLLQQPGTVVSRNRMHQELWHGRTFVEFESSLNTAISKLRQALGDSAGTSLFFETIPKIGYRFTAPVRFSKSPVVVEISPSQVAVPVEEPSPAGRQGGLSRRARWIGLGLAIGVAASVAVWQIPRRSSDVASWFSNSEPITSFGGTVGRPSFSPDGRTVAFDWNGQGRDNLDIYVMRIGSGGASRITSDPAQDFWPVWSPDGSEIAFVRASSDQVAGLYRIPVPGSGERLFGKLERSPGDRPRLDWSRDGKRFASSERSGSKGRAHVVLLDAATGEKRTLLEPPPGTLGDTEPAFSPDSKSVAFRRTVANGVEDVYICAVSGGPARRLTFDNRGISALAWRADGQGLIVSTRIDGVRQLREVPLNGRSSTRLTPASLDAGAPAVSRDGTQVVFVETFEDTNIYEVDLWSDTLPRRIVESLAQDGEPQYSPDGRRIAFRSTRAGAGGLLVANRDGTNPVRVNTLAAYLRWSPDGLRFVLDGKDAGQSDIYLVDADGSNFSRFTQDPTNETAPNWSRDGKRLYFGSDRSGVTEIWRRPVAGGPATQITTGGGNLPIESPDGGTLYYMRRSPAGILALPLIGSLPAQGRLIVALEPKCYGQWAVTPAGVYFLATDKTFPEPLRIKSIAHGTHQVKDIAPIPRQSLAIDGSFSVSPDDRFALFGLVDRAGSNLTLARQGR